MELEKLAQEEIGLIERIAQQIAHPRMVLKYARYSYDLQADTRDRVEVLNRTNKSGAIVAVLMVCNNNVAPQLDVVADGVHLFGKMVEYEVNDWYGVDAYNAHLLGSSPNPFLPYCPIYDEANNKYVVIFHPTLPYLFASSFSVWYYTISHSSGLTGKIHTWWLEDREEGGLASKAR